MRGTVAKRLRAIAARLPNRTKTDTARRRYQQLKAARKELKSMGGLR